MDITQQIEALAQCVALADATDLPALVEIDERLQKLGVAAQSENWTALCEALNAGSGLVKSIVLREVDDEDGAYDKVCEIVSFAQSVIEAAGRGEDVATVRGPVWLGDESEPRDDVVDLEMLGEWIQSCRDHCAAIEGGVLELEQSDEPEDVVASIRRSIHTIKGESGVLSLGRAQQICHELETMIDERTHDGPSGLPCDAVLALVDWLRSYADALESDPRAGAPDAAGVEALMGAVDASESAEPDSASAEVTGEPVPDEAVAAGASGSTEDATTDDGPVEFPAEAVVDETFAEFACEAREHLANSEEALMELEAQPDDAELINTVFRAFHTIKGVAGFMMLTPIVELAHHAETLLDKGRTGQIELNSPIIDLVLQSADLMGQLIGQLEGGTPPTRSSLVRLIEALEAAARGEMPAAPAGTLASGGAAKQTTEAGAAAPGAQSDAPAARAMSPAAGGTQPDKKQAKKRTDQTVKVNTGRMDSLVNLVGELVIAQQMIVQDDLVKEIKAQRTKRNLAHSVKIIRDLQEVAMSLRMVTVRGTFQKMARLVRDISARSGKSIAFHMEGEDTELDRTVVDEIADPLVHMIRNSCDHGIETAEERQAAGKPAAGHVTLRAYHSGGSIVIEIQDDGRGLNRDKILSKAIERELIAADRDPAEIPDAEVYNMVFLPGFSTADKVTDISGRGVGMDVVRRNIEALRGKTEIRSTPGEGSTFIMRLPLTMAIIDGMVIRVGEQRYVLPTLAIEQSFRPTADQLHTAGGGQGEMAMVRGSLLAIHRLKVLFDLDRGIDDLSEALLVVIDSNNERFCLAVDEIIGQQQVVIKSLGEGMKHIPGVSGGAILGDGRVAPILDPGGVIAQTRAAAA